MSGWSLFLLIYFIVYFVITFVAKTIIVAKRIGKNPLVLPRDDSAYGLVGFYFKITLIFLFVYVLTLVIFPEGYEYFLPLQYLESATLRAIGSTLLIFALVWTIIAQIHMKDSWRIGIDTEKKSELIKSGLFKYCRNPVFFGMILSLLGLFMILPNALSAGFFILSYVLIQIQIRLEEAFLMNEYGEEYRNYKNTVPRFLGK